MKNRDETKFRGLIKEFADNNKSLKDLGIRKGTTIKCDIVDPKKYNVNVVVELPRLVGSFPVYIEAMSIDTILNLKEKLFP